MVKLIFAKWRTVFVTPSYMKRTIRIICIIGAFGCFALSTTDLDIHKGKQEKLQDHEKQTAYQETAFIAE